MPSFFSDPLDLPASERESYADIEEECETLQAFAARTTNGDLVRAYDLLDNIYDATDEDRGDEVPPRRLIADWVRGRRLRDGAVPGEEGASEDFVHPLSDDDRKRNEWYAQTMDAATAQWQHLIDALRAEGVKASLWQTGGMCLAIGWSLDEKTGAHAMLTTEDGPLPHDRAEAVHTYGGDPPSSYPASWTLGVYIDTEDTGEASYLTIPGRASEPEGDERVAYYAVQLAQSVYKIERRLRVTAPRLEDAGDVRRWFDALLSYGINFHCEDTFTDTVEQSTGTRTFTDAEASRMDAAMAKAYELVEDPCEIGNAAFAEHFAKAERDKA